MKKLSLKLAVALIGFILGVSTFGVRSSWQAATKQVAAWFDSEVTHLTHLFHYHWFWRGSQTLPYCEVARNGEQYDNQIVRVRATLILDAGATYIYEDCDPVETLMAHVEMHDAIVTDKGHYLDRFPENGSNSSPKRFDAIIEGRFNARFSKGCWGLKYHIAATKVELLAPATNYVPPVYDEYACG